MKKNHFCTESTSFGHGSPSSVAQCTLFPHFRNFAFLRCVRHVSHILLIRMKSLFTSKQNQSEVSRRKWMRTMSWQVHVLDWGTLWAWHVVLKPIQLQYFGMFAISSHFTAYQLIRKRTPICSRSRLNGNYWAIASALYLNSRSIELCHWQSVISRTNFRMNQYQSDLMKPMVVFNDMIV